MSLSMLVENVRREGSRKRDFRSSRESEFVCTIRFGEESVEPWWSLLEVPSSETDAWPDNADCEDIFCLPTIASFDVI